MIYTPAQQMDTARNIARTAQRKIKNQTGMKMSIMLRPVSSIFETPEEMMEVIAHTLGIDPIYYKVKIRTRDIVEMRFIAALLLRIHFPRITLCQIALMFGGLE